MDETPLHIDTVKADIETLARGQKRDGIVDCPKCGRAISFRTSITGQVYWFQCAGAGCGVRYYEPGRIRPQNKRRGVVYPNLTLNL